MSLTAEQLAGLPDRDVADADGHGIGRIRHIYDSDHVGEPIWVTIDDDGHPNRPLRFVPLEGARVDGAGLRLAYARRVIDSAPEVADHEVIDSTTERQLQETVSVDLDREQIDLDRIGPHPPTVSADPNQPEDL